MTEIVSSKERVVEAISFLNEQDAQARKSKANLKTSLAVETIEGFARREGLSGELIIKLIDLACCGKYNESVGSKIVKSVIPQDLVPSLAVLKAVSWICTNTLSSNFQAILLRWIIVVYKLIDDLSDLQSCYGILFLFLESDILCPHACLLLSNLTKQEDVKHFRIKKLLNLQNRVGSQAHLNGLLAVYKMFCPHLVSMATSLNAVWFKNRDESWCEAVARVQANRNSKIPPERLFLHARDPSASVPKRRRVAGTVVPPPNKVQCRRQDENDNISVLELNSFADLLINIDRIELPSQIGSVLESPFLQHVLCCNPSHATLQRLNFWFYQSLHQGFLQDECNTAIDEVNTRMLQSLIQFTAFLQESIPASETWLVQYLHSWNDEDYRTLILELIKHCSLHPYIKLNELVLEPLRKLFFASSVYIKSQILCCYTDLLRNFAAFELPRAQELREETLCNTSKSASLFLEEQHSMNDDPVRTIYDFIHYVDRMCAIALQIEKDHPLLQHCVLNFFELVSVLHTEFSVPFVVIPSAAIVYRLFFADNVMACSRICQVIVNYRDTFISLKNFEKDQPCSRSVPKSGESIQTLNQYILDISDCLWRNKASLDTDKSLCFSIPWSHTDNLDIRHMNESFSLHRHAAFVGFAWTFLKQTQPKELTLNPSLIKDNVRRAYLEYLLHMKIHGVVTFLETFIRQKK